MYLKSLRIQNFRKFGDNNNTIEFVGLKGTPLQSDNINIALSTTLIVGKNNSGKTTVTEALKRLLGSRKFQANDFNFGYLNTLLDKYRVELFENFPSLEFEVTVRIDFNSDCDLVTNIAPFMNIDGILSNGQESDFRVVLKYEIQETTSFKDKVQTLVNNYKAESVLFRKFLELINSTDFKLNYYNSEGVLIGENKFKISDLLEIKIINANKILDDKSLSDTFNRIIKFRYKSDINPNVQDAVASEIDKINETITTFPIQEISISKRKGSNGALIYSFLTDGTSLYGTGYYNIEVVYGKIREVVINNTVAGTVYQMEFKTTKYHYLQEKEFNNVDSLGKAIVKIKYKFSGNEIALCKYCDGIVHDWGKYIYCGRCKKDTNGVNMYEIWGK